MIWVVVATSLMSAQKMVMDDGRLNEIWEEVVVEVMTRSKSEP